MRAPRADKATARWKGWNRIKAELRVPVLADIATLEEARNREIAPAAIGVATAGWVNADTGEVIYGTDNISGWTGSRLGSELREAFDLPVTVENDANSLAVGERRFGAARVCWRGNGAGCALNSHRNGIWAASAARRRWLWRGSDWLCLLE